MWWVIIHRDLYMYEGDLNYLREQQEYMRALLRVLASQMDGDRENLQGGQRLLDWPTSQMPDVIHAGYQALMVMAMEAGAEIGGTCPTTCGTSRRRRCSCWPGWPTPARCAGR